jgi:DNA polymerase-4
LRGEDVAEIPSKKGSVSHSHVLPPELRNDTDAWAVLQRMLFKAAMRLRHDNLKTQVLSVHVEYLGRESWSARRRIDPTADTPTLRAVTEALYRQKPPGKILKVGVFLSDVVSAVKIPEHLFPRDQGLLALSKIMDQVNQRFGIKAAYFGSLHDVLERAPMRIAFNRIPNPALESLGEEEDPPFVRGMWGAPPGGLPEPKRSWKG